MNDEKWQNYIKIATAEYGYAGVGSLNGTGHLAIAWDFFHRMNIDSADKSLLDVGCGSNQTSIVKAKWTGVDLIQNKKENTYVGDAHELPFGDENFNIVFSSHALEHTISPLICLLEMNRVLKMGGELLIGVPMDPGFITTCHNYVLTEKGWAHLIKKAGFDIIERHTQSHCANFYAKKIKVIR